MPAESQPMTSRRPPHPTAARRLRARRREWLPLSRQATVAIAQGVIPPRVAFASCERRNCAQDRLEIRSPKNLRHAVDFHETLGKDPGSYSF
jgi:hypothetical protein